MTKKLKIQITKAPNIYSIKVKSILFHLLTRSHKMMRAKTKKPHLFTVSKRKIKEKNIGSLQPKPTNYYYHLQFLQTVSSCWGK